MNQIDSALSILNNKTGFVLLHGDSATIRNKYDRILPCGEDAIIKVADKNCDRPKHCMINTNNNTIIKVISSEKTELAYPKRTVFIVTDKNKSILRESCSKYIELLKVKYKNKPTTPTYISVSGNHQTFNLDLFNTKIYSFSRSSKIIECNIIKDTKQQPIHMAICKNCCYKTISIIKSPVSYVRSNIEQIIDLDVTANIEVKKEKLNEYIINADRYIFNVHGLGTRIYINNSSNYPSFKFLVKGSGLDIADKPASASNIEKLKFVVQKNSFVEIYIKFTDKLISAVTGLPDGMYVEGDYIKGSPTLSGTYPIKIYAENSLIMESLIEVPNVIRKF